MARIALVLIAAVLVFSACSGGPSDEEAFVEWAATFREATFTVDYEMTIERPGAPPETGRLVWYQEGERARVDTGDDVVTIVREDRSYWCQIQPPERELGCIVHQANNVTLLFGPPTDFWNETHRPEDFVIAAADGRNIAGEQAKCFSLQSTRSSSQGDTEICISDDGLLVFGQIVSRGAAPPFTYTATEVSLDVPEGIFEPPYVVTGESELCETGFYRC